MDNDGDLDVLPASNDDKIVWYRKLLLIDNVNEIDKAEEINLFPNPMTDRAIIDVGEIRGPIDVEIYDAQGKLIRNEKVNSSNGSLLIKRGDLSQGSYTLRLRSGEERYSLGFVVGR